MASVNKVSLRAEFAGLKGQFEALCARGRISAKGRALVQALQMTLSGQLYAQGRE